MCRHFLLLSKCMSAGFYLQRWIAVWKGAFWQGLERTSICAVAKNSSFIWWMVLLMGNKCFRNLLKHKCEAHSILETNAGYNDQKKMDVMSFWTVMTEKYVCYQVTPHQTVGECTSAGAHSYERLYTGFMWNVTKISVSPPKLMSSLVCPCFFTSKSFTLL